MLNLLVGLSVLQLILLVCWLRASIRLKHATRSEGELRSALVQADNAMRQAFHDSAQAMFSMAGSVRTGVSAAANLALELAEHPNASRLTAHGAQAIRSRLVDVLDYTREIQKVAKAAGAQPQKGGPGG